MIVALDPARIQVYDPLPPPQVMVFPAAVAAEPAEALRLAILAAL